MYVLLVISSSSVSVLTLLFQLIKLDLRGSLSLQAEVKTKKLDAERMSDKGLRLKTLSTTTPESQLAASTSVDVNILGRMQLLMSEESRH
ncbi:hypothetical protein P3L10_008428 [Capsicum annuum]